MRISTSVRATAGQMDQTTRLKPHPSMAVALVALFVALGGTATALNGRNTVDSGDIINEQVRAPDIGTNAVGTDEVADSSLLGSDLGQDSVGTFTVFDNSLTDQDINESTLEFLPGDTRPTETTDASPSVAGLSFLSLGYEVDTTITNLTDWQVGQIVVLEDRGFVGAAQAHPTILDQGNFNLQSDWNPDNGDTLTLVFASGWIEIARSTN